jgi:hypothetical protein
MDGFRRTDRDQILSCLTDDVCVPFASRDRVLKCEGVRSRISTFCRM